MSDRLEGELRYFVHRLSPEFKKIHIVPISDAHYGNPLFSEKHFIRTLQYILETPHAFAVLNGDLLESTLRTSKGDIYKQVGSPQDQQDQMIEWLLPIKDKILGMTTGNHCYRIYNEVGFDPSLGIARALGVPYRPDGLMLQIKFGSGNQRHKDDPNYPLSYFGYMTHGYGGARTKAAKAVKVERTSYYVGCNFYIMSHDHESNAAPGIYLNPDGKARKGEDGFVSGVLRETRKIMVKSNAYLKWGGYAERGGYPPTDLQTPIITLAGWGDDFELGKYPSARAII